LRKTEARRFLKEKALCQNSALNVIKLKSWFCFIRITLQRTVSLVGVKIVKIHIEKHTARTIETK
jgi:hypothetical protein